MSSLSSLDQLQSLMIYSLMWLFFCTQPYPTCFTFANFTFWFIFLESKLFTVFSSYQVVESMRLGMEPRAAAKDAISRIARKFPNFVGAVFAVNKNGEHGGACHGWTFQYSVRSPEMDDVEVFTVFPWTWTRNLFNAVNLVHNICQGGFFQKVLL